MTHFRSSLENVDRDAGGLQEQIDHERTGLLVRPDDPAALRERLSAAATAETITMPESAAARLATLYQTVLPRAT